MALLLSLERSIVIFWFVIQTQFLISFWLARTGHFACSDLTVHISHALWLWAISNGWSTYPCTSQISLLAKALTNTHNSKATGSEILSWPYWSNFSRKTIWADSLRLLWCSLAVWGDDSPAHGTHCGGTICGVVGDGLNCVLINLWEVERWGWPISLHKKIQHLLLKAVESALVKFSVWPIMVRWDL